MQPLFSNSASLQSNWSAEETRKLPFNYIIQSRKLYVVGSDFNNTENRRTASPSNKIKTLFVETDAIDLRMLNNKLQKATQAPNSDCRYKHFRILLLK
jgi:hypothetical protein